MRIYSHLFTVLTYLASLVPSGTQDYLIIDQYVGSGQARDFPFFGPNLTAQSNLAKPVRKVTFRVEK